MPALLSQSGDKSAPAVCPSPVAPVHACCIYSLCLAANAHPLPGPANVPPAKTLPTSQPVVVAVSLAVAHRRRLMYIWVAISPSAERLTQLGRLRYVTDKQTDKQIWSFRPRPDRRFGLPTYLPSYILLLLLLLLLLLYCRL